jgi:hypothetical protein
VNVDQMPQQDLYCWCSVWDGTGEGEPEATSQPAAELQVAEVQPALLPPPGSPEAAAAATAQDADAEGEAATAQGAGGSQKLAGAAEQQPVQAGLAAALPDQPETDIQVADVGAAAAPPASAADRDSDSDVTRDEAEGTALLLSVQCTCMSDHLMCCIA